MLVHTGNPSTWKTSFGYSNKAKQSEVVLIHIGTPHNIRALLHPAPPCPSGSAACAPSLTGPSCSVPQWYFSSLDRFSQAPKQTYLALFTFMPLSPLDLCSPAIPMASLFGLRISSMPVCRLSWSVASQRDVIPCCGQHTNWASGS